MSITIQPSQTVDVCLVVPPYAPVERPAIGVSILKAALNQAKISSTILYANMMWAEEIGVHIYDALTKNMEYELTGEWTFSNVAFPSFNPDHDQYFKIVQKHLRALKRSLEKIDNQKDIQSILWDIRNQSPVFIEKIVQDIIALQPRIVGCSSTLQQHCASLAILRRVKELRPDITTVIGGANCEASMGVVTHKLCSWIDFVVSGEADIIFPELCQKIIASNGNDLDIRNLSHGIIGPAHRKDAISNHTLLEQLPPRAKVTNLDETPIPDYDSYFHYLQNSPISHWIEPALIIETSRGCWWGEVSHCKFCGINGDNMHYRSKDADRAFEEFQYLAHRYQINRFAISDAILDMDYFKSVIPHLIDNDDTYNIWYDLKANLKREQLEKLAQAGICWIQPGIEHLNNRLLKLLGKGTTTYQNLQTLKWAQEFGIYVDWVFLYDIPGETDQDYMDLVKWLPKISHLQPAASMAYIRYHRFSPYYMRPDLFNLTLSPSHSYHYVFPWETNDLEQFAYCFDDYTANREQIDLHEHLILQKPGLDILQTLTTEWRREWMGRLYPDKDWPYPATLVMLDDGEQLDIVDTRACAVQPKFHLTGLARVIYLICDKARKSKTIMKSLSETDYKNYSWDDVEPVLKDLCDKNLILELDGYFLSLAIRGPLKPLSEPKTSIGGIIELNPFELLQRIMGGNMPIGFMPFSQPTVPEPKQDLVSGFG